MNGLDIGFADLAESGRGRDLEFAAPTDKNADLTHRLQLRHISWEEGERHLSVTRSLGTSSLPKLSEIHADSCLVKG
jgi:hypothetical protein